MHGFTPDDDRLAELILYVSGRCADWEEFDPIVMARILFQADFLHYREHGASISGQAYRRGPTGPAPRGLPRVLRGLAREFAIQEFPLGDGLHVRRRPAALRAARASLFKPGEIAIVEQVIEYYRDTWSPDRECADFLPVPWKTAAPRELIPYLTARSTPGPRRAEALASAP